MEGGCDLVAFETSPVLSQLGLQDEPGISLKGRKAWLHAFNSHF